MCQLQKSVRKLTEMCRICVRKLSDSKICKKSVRLELEMSQKCGRTKNCVRKLSVSDFQMCQKSVRTNSTDRYLTHLYSDLETFSGNIATFLTHEKIWHRQFSDTIFSSDTFQKHFQFQSDRFLTYFLILQFSDSYPTHFRQFSDSF